MLPKVHSLSSLQGAAVRSVAQRSSQATARDSSAGRRRSVDTPSRSRSRPGSCVDLVSLDLDIGSATGALSITIPRPSTPQPSLWPLIESPASFSANDALAHMAVLSASLEAARGGSADIKPTWTAASAAPAPLAVATVPAAPEVTAPVNVAPAPSPIKVTTSDARVPEPISSLASSVTTPAAPEAPAPSEPKAKRKSKRVGPAARPGPDEVRIYRTTMAMDYVQELLGNLTHVQRMFRGVAGGPSSTAAAAAAAAARLLSRSFSRAASRVRESVKDANAVLLSEDALVTLAEFGWVEVSTEDPEQAKLMGCVEAEVHHLPSGRIASYQRPAVDKAWWQVGDALPTPSASPYNSFPSSPRSTLDGLDASSPPTSESGAPTAMPNTINASGAKLDVPARPASATGASVAGRGGLMTIAGLADHLQSVSQSVLSAALHLNQWLEEHKATLQAAATSNNTSSSSQPATTVVGFSPTAALAAI